MRKELKKMNGKRMAFIATVERFGEKSGFKGPSVATILLKNVCVAETGKVVTDHIWFAKGKSWSSCSVGSEVCFEARVTEYEKGYKGHREDVYAPITLDYKLERPTKVIVLGAA